MIDGMRRWRADMHNRKRDVPDRLLQQDHVSAPCLALPSVVSRSLLAAICLNGLVSAGAALAQASDAVSTTSAAKSAAPQFFDISSQPLEDALYAFDAAAGIEVFVDGASIAGRRSTAIKGLFAPAEALRAILAGTGLEARMIGPRAITLAPGEAQNAPNSSAYRTYSALVQDAVIRRLCAEPDIRPGSYRIAAQLWLAPTGAVSDASLLSSTGNPERDRRVRRVLAGLSIGKSPPPTLPQPIIMVILPRPPQESGDCG